MGEFAMSEFEGDMIDPFLLESPEDYSDFYEEIGELKDRLESYLFSSDSPEPYDAGTCA